MRRLKVVRVAAIVVVGLLAAKSIVHALGFEFIALSGLVTALIGGVTFTLSILFAGAVPDYKESEKIPGEMALAIKNLYKDVHIVASKNDKIHWKMHQDIMRLSGTILRNFKEGAWRQREINEEMDVIDESIVELAQKGVTANYIIKMRTELSSIERLSNRVETIKDTTFLPPAHCRKTTCRDGTRNDAICQS